MHVGIDLLTLVGFSSSAMIVSYIAFIPPEAASRRIIALRDRFVERRGNGRHRLVTPRREPPPRRREYAAGDLRGTTNVVASPSSSESAPAS
jgi:hypothetical protein